MQENDSYCDHDHDTTAGSKGNVISSDTMINQFTLQSYQASLVGNNMAAINQTTPPILSV